MLSDKTQPQDKCRRAPLYELSKIGKPEKAESGSCQGPGKGWREGELSNGQFQVHKMKIFYRPAADTELIANDAVL